jgi:hypothetical protein
MKNCFYCNKQVDEESAVDICTSCGFGVWGEKMFNAIRENMRKAKDSGNID